MPIRTAPKTFRDVPRVPPDQWPAATDPIWSLVGLPRSEVEALDAVIAGFVYFPGLPDYEQARAGEDDWPTPSLIVYCESRKDVAACLRFVQVHGLPVSIRSGGHNTGGYHLCGGLVIDVSHLTAVNVDANGRITVEPGVTFDALDKRLEGTGLAVPSGTCGDVCCAGYFLGGGYSLISRIHGLGCDSVVSATMMTADGRIVQTPSEEDPDLLWGLLGGSGGQFGVLLELVLQGQKVGELWAFLAKWSLDDAAAVLTELEANHMWQPHPVPAPFGYLCALTYFTSGIPISGEVGIDPDPSLGVLGMFAGTRAEGLAHLKDVLAIGTPVLVYDKVTTYSTANTELFSFFPYEALDLADAQSVSSSGLVAPEGKVDWAGLVQQAREAPNPGNLIAVEPYGGAIASNDHGRTSFPHREQKLDLLVDSFWNPAWQYESKTRSSAERWLTETMQVVAPALSGRTYVNYAQRGLRDYRSQYWAESFDRLLQLRQRYDPDDVFRFDQSINWAPPALPPV